MKTRAVIYARCSTDEESQKDALIRQVAEAKECVRKKGWLLVDMYVESRSGTSTKGRTEYNRLYADLRKDKFDVIVIKSQDRLMRNTKDWYLFADRLTVSLKKLYMYIENKYYSTDDTLLTGIKAILAEEYSRELSKKINNAHRNRQKSGSAIILTSNTYGYRRMPDKTIEVIKEEAEVKRRMYQLCAGGYGCRAIAAILKKDGIHNRKGGWFSDSDILRMIRNPINKGTVVMNRKHYDFDSRRILKVPQENHFVYEHMLPQIVSEELWEAANRAIDGRAGKRAIGKSSSAGSFPLSGRLYCGFCNEPYYRTVRRMHSDRRKIYEWKCRRYLQEGRRAQSESSEGDVKSGSQVLRPTGCNNIHLNEEQLDRLLESEQISHYRADKDKIIRKMTEMVKLVLSEEDMQSEIDREEKNCQQLTLQMSLLVDKLLNGVLTDEVFQIKQRDLEKKLKESRAKIKTLEHKSGNRYSCKDQVAVIEAALRKTNMIQKAAAEEVVRRIDKIVIYPQYMELVFFMRALPEEALPGSSKAQPKRLRIEYGNQFDYFRQKREEREIIADMMRENPYITAGKISEELGISLSGVNYRIRALKKEGRIRFDGSGGKGKWEVSEADGSSILRP